MIWWKWLWAFIFEGRDYENVNYLIKSKRVSAVNTCLVVAEPFIDLDMPPEPGRIVVTKMIPKTTAQTVVVK